MECSGHCTCDPGYQVNSSNDGCDAITFSEQRMYPPIRILTSSSQRISNEIYGNGIYKTWGPSKNSKPYNAFNYDENYYGLTNNYNNGEFIGNSYVSENYYKGDGIIIKLPYKIKLTWYGFRQRDNHSSRAPGQYKIYGSNNKKNLDVLVHKTSNIEYNYGAYFENVITSNEYQFFALVVNRLIGNERVLTLINGISMVRKGFFLKNPHLKVRKRKGGTTKNEKTLIVINAILKLIIIMITHSVVIIIVSNS